MEDPYQILGVARDASLDEVRQAYRRLAAVHHPDAGGDAWAFQRVHDAYSRIMEKRGSLVVQTAHTDRPQAPRSNDWIRRRKRANTRRKLLLSLFFGLSAFLFLIIVVWAAVSANGQKYVALKEKPPTPRQPQPSAPRKVELPPVEEPSGKLSRKQRPKAPEPRKEAAPAAPLFLEPELEPVEEKQKGSSLPSIKLKDGTVLPSIGGLAEKMTHLAQQSEDLTSLNRKDKLQDEFQAYPLAYKLFSVRDVSGVAGAVRVEGVIPPGNDFDVLAFTSKMDKENLAASLKKGEWLFLVGKPSLYIDAYEISVDFSQFPAVLPIPAKSINGLNVDSSFVDGFLEDWKKTAKQHAKKLKELRTKYLRAKRARSKNAQRIQRQIRDLQSLQRATAAEHAGFRMRLGR